MAKKIVCAIVWFIGLIVILCAIGGYEADLFGTVQFVVRAVIGGCLVLVTSIEIGRG